MCASWRPHVTKGLVLAAALLVAQVASAQSSAQGSDPEAGSVPERQTANPNVIEEVQVRGQRMSEIEFNLPDYVRKFIGEVVALPQGGGHARWYKSVCVSVVNLEPARAQYIVDRISLLAGQVGLKPGEPGCTPQVIVIFTVDADDVATNLVETQPLLFRPGGPACCMQLGLDALDEFKTSDKPVRWWHVSMPVDALLHQRAIQLGQDGPGNYPVITVEGPSRIHSGLIDELYRAIIVVDATKLTGTTWQQIGDYLAVVSLAQVNPNTDPSAYDSILNVFSNPAAYSGLTDWDLSYVQALYKINLERLPGLQENQLVSRMVRTERDQAE